MQWRKRHEHHALSAILTTVSKQRFVKGIIPNSETVTKTEELVACDRNALKCRNDGRFSVELGKGKSLFDQKEKECGTHEG